MEKTHSGFQAAIAGIDVLNVGSPFSYALSSLHIDKTMCNSSFPGKGLVDAGTVRAKDGIWINRRAECRDGMGGIEFLQAKIGRLTTAIADDQNGNLIGACSPSTSHASSPLGRGSQVALSLEGLKEEGLICLNDSTFMLGLVPGGVVQKPVAPEEGSVFVDQATICRSSYNSLHRSKFDHT